MVHGARGCGVKSKSDYRDAPLPDLDADEGDALLPDAASGSPCKAGAPDVVAETRRWTVEATDHAGRLDKALVLRVPEFSRSHLQSLIAQGEVTIDDRVTTTASCRLRLGQSVSIRLMPTAQAQAFRPEAMPLDVRFEDEHVLVLNKPPGLVVHPAPGHWGGTLLNGLLAHHLGAAVLPRAGIVHRLDRDTSGVMVVAKTLVAMQALVRAISAREVRRVYWAIAWGSVAPDEQEVQAPIGRDPRSRIRMAVVGSGKPSRTSVRVMGRAAEGLTALECRLHTGRTHQIRVHLAHLGHPLVADAVYGGAPSLGLARQALHARYLSFAHPVTHEPMDFDVPLPPDLHDAWERLTSLG